jgi:phosphate transport system substrate-binding protein
MNHWKTSVCGVAAGCLGVALAACGGTEAGQTGSFSGAVALDGSSTVYPITEAIAEEFQRANRAVRVTVGISGTGGGFKKLCAGEIDVSDASRPIKESELARCRANEIEVIEIPVAWDGITVVVHPDNDWAECLTTEELKRIWQPGSTLRRWKEIRDGWPEREIELYGPDTDSGTFDYFTEAIVGEEDASRSDYTASADDNVLVIGVQGDVGGLGYFGYAYYAENRDRLKALAVDAGSGCVEPSVQTIENGSYRPLSRHMFIYVNESALGRPEVRGFVEFYLENAPELVPEVGYVALSAATYEASLERLASTTVSGGR